MNPWKKIILFVAGVFGIVFIAVYLFLVFRGKSLIISQLESATHRKTTMAYFGLTPPFNLQIKDLKIEGLAKAESIYLSPSIFGFLRGDIAMNSLRIVRPELYLERTADQKLEAQAQPRQTQTVNPPTSGAVETRDSGASSDVALSRPLRLAIKRLKVQDGKINFVDHAIGREGIKITIKNVNISLSNLYFPPSSRVMNLDLQARIPWQAGSEEGKVIVDGWVNLYKKDMRAAIKVEDIEGVYLYPYYAQWVDLEKARIQSAKLNFTCDLSSLNNDMNVSYQLELTDIVRRPLGPGESDKKEAKMTDGVLDLFKALDQGKIVLRHNFKTKMDRPQFGFGSIKMAVENKLTQAKGGVEIQDILRLPGKLLEGTVRGATDFSKAVIDGTFAIGNELKKSVEDTFRKTPAPVPVEK